MPIPIQVVVTGDLSLREKFDTFPQRAHTRLHRTIEEFTERLYGRIRAAMPHRTGELASELRELVDDKPEKITGLVYIRGNSSNDFAKAGALEYGAHGTAHIAAHAMALDHVFANRLASPLKVMVDAYSRQVNIHEHRFLRGSLDAMKAEIKDALQDAIAETVGET